ncbi:hypothetical protein CCH79_00014504, partial [Gambusia affinis]
MNHLHISDVQLSDSATYYCGSSYSNLVEFGEGVFLNVEGTNRVEIVQEPNSETLQPGSSVTFNCTVDTEACEGGHTVLWFRHGAYQAVLHTHTRINVKQPLLNKSSHRPKSNLSSSDAGTYYCVVASCGKLLFGSGSELLIRRHAEERLSQTGIFLWLSVFRSGILLLFVMICVCIYIRKS